MMTNDRSFAIGEFYGMSTSAQHIFASNNFGIVGQQSRTFRQSDILVEMEVSAVHALNVLRKNRTG